MTITLSDVFALAAAAWLFWSSVNHLGRMNKRTSYMAFFQALAVGSMALALILSYAQLMFPSAIPSHWLNIRDMQALLLAAAVVSLIIDPRLARSRESWSERKRAVLRQDRERA